MVLDEKLCQLEKKFLWSSTRFITGHKESQFAARLRNVLIIFQLIINFTRVKGLECKRSTNFLQYFVQRGYLDIHIIRFFISLF